MSTLTNAQRAYVRQESSDMFAPFLVDDPNMDVLYTQALAFDANEPLPATIYYTLRRMLARLVAKECDLTEDARKERIRQVEKLMALWKTEAGIFGGKLFVGALDYDLDADEINVDQWDELDYPYGY